MVLEREKPTTFPGMTLLYNNCHSARDQQVGVFFKVLLSCVGLCYNYDVVCLTEFISLKYNVVVRSYECNNLKYYRI